MLPEKKAKKKKRREGGRERYPVPTYDTSKATRFLGKRRFF
jgi:hypothetical protein